MDVVVSPKISEFETSLLIKVTFRTKANYSVHIFKPKNKQTMRTTTFLTFVGDQCGKAKEALDFYTSLFPNSEVKSLVHYAQGEAGGTPELIKYGVFTLNGTEYRVSESNYDHKWSFTPGVSLFVDSDSEMEVENLFEKLVAHGGMVLMPLDNYKAGDYGFGKKFGWVQDKYGISWQVNLTE